MDKGFPWEHNMEFPKFPKVHNQKLLWELLEEKIIYQMKPGKRTENRWLFFMDESVVCSLRIGAKPSFIQDLHQGCGDGSSLCNLQGSVGTKFSQAATCHPNGKELHKDLRKLTVGAKGGQRSTDPDKYDQIHLEIKSSRWVYCMGLNTEMAVMAQKRVFSCCWSHQLSMQQQSKIVWALSGRKKEGII